MLTINCQANGMHISSRSAVGERSAGAKPVLPRPSAAIAHYEWAHEPSHSKEGQNMKVYTRKGDSGQPSIWGGRRLSKDHARMEAIGSVDEASAAITALTE